MKPWSRICKNDGNNWLACSQPNRNHTSILEERNMQWEGCYVTRQEGGRQGYRSPTKNNVRNLTNEHGAMHWLDWNHIFLPMTTRLQKCPLPLSLSLSLSLALSLSLFLSLLPKENIKDISLCSSLSSSNSSLSGSIQKRESGIQCKFLIIKATS